MPYKHRCKECGSWFENDNPEAFLTCGPCARLRVSSDLLLRKQKQYYVKVISPEIVLRWVEGVCMVYQLGVLVAVSNIPTDATPEEVWEFLGSSIEHPDTIEDWNATFPFEAPCLYSQTDSLAERLDDLVSFVESCQHFIQTA